MTVKAEHVAGDRYRVRVYAGRDRFGKPHQRSKSFRAANQREANKVAAKFETELRDRIDKAAVRGKTVNGLVDDWQKLRDSIDSPSTIRGRRALIVRIRKGLGAIVLDDLSARHVDEWMTGLRAAGLTSDTIANHHSQLRAILRQGELWDMCTDKATKRVKPPSRARKVPKPPTAAAVDVLLASAPPDLRLCGELAARAGLRRGEIVALRWSDIECSAKVSGEGAGNHCMSGELDLPPPMCGAIDAAPALNTILHVRRAVVETPEGGLFFKLPKSRQTRQMTVDPDLHAMLAGQFQRHVELATTHGVDMAVDGFIIANPYARDDRKRMLPVGSVPRRPGWLTLAWQRHTEKHGGRVRFHDLRHWHATELIDDGVSLAAVQRRLGHLQLSTTLNVYAHAVDGSDEIAARAIQNRRRPAELST